MITTSDGHPPRRIAEAVHRAFHGDLKLHYDVVYYLIEGRAFIEERRKADMERTRLRERALRGGCAAGRSCGVIQ